MYPVSPSTSSAIRFFFFSSRRRHTRLQGDWSSDVCSSDLVYLVGSNNTGVGGPGPRAEGAAPAPPPPQPERQQSPTQRHFGYANLAGYPRSEERRVGKERGSRG